MNKIAITVAVIVTAAIAMPAFAADMAVKAPPPPPVLVPSWTGFYIGGNLGYGWRDPTVSFTPNDVVASGVTCAVTGCPTPESFGVGGVLGGAQAGYNWQAGHNFLLGLEADFQETSI